eukprot:867204-Pelagomonas_calceolata.AAC.4
MDVIQDLNLLNFCCATCSQAQEQGKASQLINKDVDAMHGFSQLVFVERGDVHVAVATSLQQNKCT